MSDIELKLANVQERLSLLQSELENPQRAEEEILQIHQEIFTLEGVIPILEEKLARFNEYINANNQQYSQQDEFSNAQEDEDEDYELEYDDYNNNQFYGPAQAMKRSRYQPYSSQQSQQLQQLQQSQQSQQLPNQAHDQQLVQLNELIQQQQRHDNDENQDLYQYIDLLQAKLLATEQLLEAKDRELNDTKTKLSTALKQIRNGNNQQQMQLQYHQQIQLQSRSPLLIDWRNDTRVIPAQKQYYQNIETILNENAIAMKRVCPDIVFEIADYCHCDHQVENQSLADAFDLALGLHSMTDELPDENDPIYVIFGSNRGKIKLQVQGNGAIVDMNNAMLFDFLNPGTQCGWVKGCGGSKDSTRHYHIEFTW